MKPIVSINGSTMIHSKEQIECPDGYTLVPNRTIFLSTDIITEGIKSSGVPRGIMTDYSSNKYICKKPALINFDLNTERIINDFKQIENENTSMAVPGSFNPLNKLDIFNREPNVSCTFDGKPYINGKVYIDPANNDSISIDNNASIICLTTPTINGNKLDINSWNY
jgi:hypothetical protein